VIISSRRRFAFVHIPKTGGTSFMRAYEDRAAADDLLIGDTPKARRRKRRLEGLAVPGRLWKHSTLRDVGDLVPEDAFVCTLVRNPWDRLVSYYHWLRAQRFAHPAVARAKALDFRAFLRDPLIQAAEQANPAASYVTRADGTLHCNAFIMLEHPEDYAPVWDHLGFRLTIPHLNRSERSRDWRGYYSDAEIEIVAELAADDIARFGYRPE
jgi:hypothetical protein